MAEIVGKVDLKEMAKSITMEITLKNEKQLRWRIWIACQLIRLAAWVSWFDIEFVNDES